MRVILVIDLLVTTPTYKAGTTILGDRQDGNMLLNATLRIHQAGPGESSFKIVDITILVSGKQIGFTSIYYYFSIRTGVIVFSSS